MTCYCIKHGKRESCLNNFNCHICGVCLLWQGYEEGTTTCGCHYNLHINIISRDDIKEILKKELNKDVVEKIASFIAHPIHEYIGVRYIYYKGDSDLNLRVCGWTARDFIIKHGYNKYKEERKRGVLMMNNLHGFRGFANPYLPVTMDNLKNEIILEGFKNGVKIYKSWTKKKMIQHYYKSVN